jgi:hypothetical protein
MEEQKPTKDLVEKKIDITKNTKNNSGFLKFLIPKKELHKNSFRYKFRYADIGNKALGTPIKSKDLRLGQRILNLLTTIFGLNLLSFGFIGTFCLKFYDVILPMQISLIISVIAVALLIILRKFIAALAGRLIKGK